MIARLLELLKYPSTYQGLVILLTVAGVTLSPEQAAAITAAGAAVAGLLLVFLSDADVK